VIILLCGSVLLLDGSDPAGSVVLSYRVPITHLS
jgi:hypothetical protein